jgi:hypothetical protein
MRRLRQYLRGVSKKPVSAVAPCRFGEWLDSPVVQQHWHELPQFAELVRLHRMMHVRADALLLQRKSNVQIQESQIENLERLSTKLIGLCRSLWYLDEH